MPIALRTRRCARRAIGARRCALLCAAFASLAVCMDVGARPLAVTNQAPLTRLYGVPVAQSPRADGRNAWSVQADWSSHATVSTRGNEAIALDGESLVLTGRGELTRGPWRVALALPFVHQYGGVLDSLIDDYHAVFGFPDGDRPILGQDQLLYRYLRDDSLLLNRQRGSNGPGDARVGVQRTLLDRPAFAVAAHAQLKLPTGDSDRLLGSGGTDLAVGVAAERNVALLGRDTTLYGGLGVLFSARGDVLPAMRERVISYGHAGVAWPWTPTVTLNLQLDAHSSPYRSALSELGNALQFSAGLAWAVTPTWSLVVALNEDISVHSSPDVTFQFGLRRSD